MTLTDKNYIINVFTTLGQRLSSPDETLSAVINNEHYHNAWFTQASVMQAIKAAGNMLNEGDLTTWLNKYKHLPHSPKRVGLILAGNIPMVGFHDIICVLATGNMALIKLSSQDSRLIRHVLQMLIEIEPALSDQIIFTERLTEFDAVIATGSNNTSRYFDYYFGKVPNIIRKNRNSIALLTGTETAQELFNLGHDIFDYYGLGCRNVSKLLVPAGYNFNFFFESIEAHKAIIHHHKYNNNYDYNKSIYLVNGDPHLDNGFLMVKEDDRMASPLSVLYFSYYADMAAAQQMLTEQTENLQCIVTTAPVSVPNQVVGFGQSQQPALWDYADGIDTMEFLANL